MSKEHMNYLRRKTADEAELWAADRIEELEDTVNHLILESTGWMNAASFHRQKADQLRELPELDAKAAEIAEQVAFDAGAASRDAEIAELVALLTRYRNETPLGHQPHMIAHLVDEALAKVRKP